MDLEKKYYAKLMLVGEYGVILGGEALTVPLKQFHATLAHREQESDQQRAIASINHLRNLAIYLRELPKNSFFATPDIDALQHLVTRGFFVRSTVPEGYGVGSSGVVSAIVYDQFFHDSEGLQPAQLKKDLAVIESHFHGKSSGVDALSCYMDSPLHFRSADTVEKVEFDPSRIPGGYRFFLVDSGAVFETGPLVNHFLDALKDPQYERAIRGEFLPFNTKLIDLLTGRKEGDPALLFRAVSDFQFRHFRRMIPDHMEDAWIHGQVSNAYYLKLNGSGGGFVLGICHEHVREEVEAMFEGSRVAWVG